MHITSPYRQISHQKLLLLLIVALKYQIVEETAKFEIYFQKDVAFCPTCFQIQARSCAQIFKELDSIEEFSLFALISTIGRRDISLLKLKSENTKVISKYLAKRKSLLRSEINQEDLTKEFLNESRLDGLQFCPKSSLQRLINLFKPRYEDLTIWLYLNVNVQPLLMPYLDAVGGFPIPKTFASCGFSIFQRYAGKTLRNFYRSDFNLKLEIAKQLLKAALRFTEGFNGFRIYITDLNFDNIAYDEALNHLTFVDLDTVLLVDAQSGSQEMDVHQHQYIECMDCFAYSPADICQSQVSDINIFASCQLLREDLNRDITKGFLYPVPQLHSNLSLMLKLCFDCPSAICENRFDAALDIIKYIEQIQIKHVG